MPLDCLHMTTLEITHSLTESEIEQLVETIGPSIPSVSHLIAQFSKSYRTPTLLVPFSRV